MSGAGGPGRQRNKNDKTKGSNSTCSGKGSIQSFFNGTAKVKKRTVVCPICTVDVELIKINEHMDSRECQEKSSELVEEKKTEVIKSSSLKRNLAESVPDTLRDHKKLKPSPDVENEVLVAKEELLKTPEKKKILPQELPSIKKQTMNGNFHEAVLQQR